MGLIIPKEMKYNMHYGDVRETFYDKSDRLGRLRCLTSLPTWIIIIIIRLWWVHSSDKESCDRHARVYVVNREEFPWSDNKESNIQTMRSAKSEQKSAW